MKHPFPLNLQKYNTNITNKFKRVDDFFQTEINHGFPGVGLCIIHNNQIIKMDSYGYKLKYSPDGDALPYPLPITINTIFDLASNTKMYATTFALMHLVAEGKIDINASVYKYLPDFGKQCQQHKLITVKNLLNHCAGLAPDIHFYNPREVKPELYSQNKSLTEQILLARLPCNPEQKSPIYSDIDFMFLGIIIEHITGMPLDKYVETTIYKPLGLLHTVYNPLNKGIVQADCAATEINGNTRGKTIFFPNVRTQVLQGEVHDEKCFYSMGGVSGHAGLFSTLPDMAVLCQLMLNNGSYNEMQFWNKEVQDLFTTPHPMDNTFGLGWKLAGNHELPWMGNYPGNQAYGHTGWTGTATVIDPNYNLAIILLTNKRHSPCIEGVFATDNSPIGKYTKIIDLVYQSFIS